MRDQLRDYLARTAANYFLGSFMFGGFPPEQVRSSLELFAREVIPAVAPATTSVPAGLDTPHAPGG